MRNKKAGQLPGSRGARTGLLAEVLASARGQSQQAAAQKNQGSGFRNVAAAGAESRHQTYAVRRTAKASQAICAAGRRARFIGLVVAVAGAVRHDVLVVHDDFEQQVAQGRVVSERGKSRESQGGIIVD